MQIATSAGILAGIGSTTLILMQSIMVYAVAFALLLLLGRLLGLSVSRADLGLSWLRWSDLAIAVVGFIVYAIIGTAVMVTLKALFPDLALEQAQDFGFKTVYGGERVLAFIALVIMAPVVEELLFRGLLYGKMRRSGMNVAISTLIVSLLFALAHMQLNVGIDVFILSIILCLVREYTGSIGTSIVIHMMKNALAFYVLFIAASTTAR